MFDPMTRFCLDEHCSHSHCRDSPHGLCVGDLDGRDDLRHNHGAHSKQNTRAQTFVFVVPLTRVLSLAHLLFTIGASAEQQTKCKQLVLLEHIQFGALAVHCPSGLVVCQHAQTLLRFFDVED